MNKTPVINPKSGRAFVYMTFDQAQRGAELHGGTPARAKAGGSWFLLATSAHNFENDLSRPTGAYEVMA